MDKFIEQPITNTLKENYMPYAMSVIISRAIPEIDGFKPSHRKLLYTMYKMGLLTGNRTKSANVVGQTMKLNPHGDMAIYETMVRLTKGNGALLHPFVDSKGNFGKQYSRDMAFAASRYTEVKLDKICAEIFSDIDKNTVEFTDNYDGTLKEPLFLPTTYPNILVNPNQGIAVGMASNICSFNLKEICDATVAYIQDPDIDFTQYILAPDFSTGGELLYNENEIRNIYETGRGTFKVRAKYQYDKKNSCIDILEIPYSTTTEAIMDKIIDLIKSGRVKEINDIRDETDLNGLKITLDIKKTADPDLLMTRLFKLTPLCDTFGCNFNILIGGQPRVMGIKEILDEWIQFRLNCLKRQISYDLVKKSERLHLLKGLGKILLDIDKAIKIIRDTEKDSEVLGHLMQGFGIDETQAEFICEIKLRNLNKEYILKKLDETDALEKELAELKDTLEHEEKIKILIVRKLKEVSKNYGTERRTSILYEHEVEEVPEEHFIEEYPLKLFFTKDNYFKKISLVSLRSSGEQRLKDEDVIVTEVEANNKWDLLLFSDRCNVYKLKIYDIKDSKASNLGDYLPNVLDMEPDEKIVDIVPTEKYEGKLLFAFENGKIAKIPLKSYETKTNRKKLSNAYGSAAKLVKLLYLNEDTDLVVTSSIGKILICNTESIAEKASRSAQGVQVMNLRKNSRLKDIALYREGMFHNDKYYRTKNIPAVGCFLKEEDREEKQLNLFE